MTIKEWNNLEPRKRRQLINMFFWNMSPEFKKDMAEEYHHNFNWQGEANNHQEGRWYKLFLSHLKLTPEGSVKMTVKV